MLRPLGGTGEGRADPASQPLKHLSLSLEPSEGIEAGSRKKKTNVEIKMGKGGPPPCVDQDISDFGGHVSYLTLSILSRQDLIYGGFLSARFTAFSHSHSYYVSYLFIYFFLVS